VLANNVIQNNFQGPRRGHAHHGLHQHGEENDKECSAIRADKAEDETAQSIYSRLGTFANTGALAGLLTAQRCPEFSTIDSVYASDSMAGRVQRCKRVHDGQTEQQFVRIRNSLWEQMQVG